MSPYRVEHLRRLALRVPDLATATAFYRDVWKLLPLGQQGAYHAFRTLAHDHADFMLREGPAGIDHVCFSVSTQAALDGLTAHLREGGVAIADLAPDDLFPGETRGVAFQDSDGRNLRLVLATPSAAPLREDRDPLAPLAIGHLVLWSPDQPRAEAFFAQLGFQVTDRTHLDMSFLRCNRDHHTVALVKSGSGKAGIQHIAFDVATIDNVMRNFARLRDLGLECVWGVGRHGPGNNVFSYYQDPAGNFIEYYGDMDPQPDAFPQQEIFWGPEHKGDIWGVAGRPPARFTQ